MYEMRFYCQRTPDGLIHVTNMLMGLQGQHHVHTDTEFRRWAASVTESLIDWEVLKQSSPCTCGLQNGKVAALREPYHA